MKLTFKKSSSSLCQIIMFPLVNAICVDNPLVVEPVFGITTQNKSSIQYGYTAKGGLGRVLMSSIQSCGLQVNLIVDTLVL